MQTDSGSIFSHLNGLLFARHGRRKSEVTFPEKSSKNEDEASTSVSLVRMAKLSNSEAGTERCVKDPENNQNGKLTSPYSEVCSGKSQRTPLPTLFEVDAQPQPPSPKLASSTSRGRKAASPLIGKNMSGPMKTAAPPPLPPRRGDLPPIPGHMVSAHVSLVEGGQLPPPLPRRKASLRAPTHVSEFETRFRFHPMSDLPPPEEFSAGKKTYPSLLQKSDMGASPDRLPPPPLQPHPPPPPR